MDVSSPLKLLILAQLLFGLAAAASAIFGLTRLLTTKDKQLRIEKAKKSGWLLLANCCLAILLLIHFAKDVLGNSQEGKLDAGSSWMLATDALLIAVMFFLGGMTVSQFDSGPRNARDVNRRDG